MKEHQELFKEMADSLKRIERELIRKMHIPDVSLTKRQEAIIMYIFTNENATMADIADNFNISKSAVSQALNKLEEQDIIVRAINKDNRREINLTPGEAGEKYKKEIQKLEEILVEKYLSKIDLDELRQTRNLFSKIENLILEEDQKNEL
ncbi:MarR family winged helix-turn-helix transcriptional regulator [Thalassobacillus sp. C254]|uniref:MarR family winged helix-turn-helix transcriptional regulator n=1 Tax=Thalassobacillus sp. C254 TaxID=1225341 RepID=UPI0009F8D2EB|nr:MarR family transcriptional regulator [Thalassobacillus sp. C254]